jgi:hypothetical protein
MSIMNPSRLVNIEHRIRSTNIEGYFSFLFRAVFRKPFLPSLHNMRHIPFNDLHALEQTLSCLQYTGDDAGKTTDRHMPNDH